MATHVIGLTALLHEGVAIATRPPTYTLSTVATLHYSLGSGYAP